MAPSFSKSAILMGAVDHLCLVCEAHLKCDEDVLAHIGKPVHKKSLDATQYVETLEKDNIRKIKNKYFCEFCNFLMNTLAKVRVHVNEQAHVDNVRKLSLSRIGKGVIAFDEIMITEQAWNGLHNNSCAICSTEYEEENIHRNQTTHVLNLVQVKVEYDEGNNIYRKIDQTTFHCITCNTVLALNSKDSHWNTTEHKNLYEACRDAKLSASVEKKGSTKSLLVPKNNTVTEKNDVIEFVKQNTNAEVANSATKEDTNINKMKEVTMKDRTEIFDVLAWLQKSGIRVTFETDLAYCQKCSSTLTLDLTVLKDHIKQHEETKTKNNTTSKNISNVELNRDKPNTHTSKTEKEEIEEIVKSNNMEIHHDEKIIYCKICKIKISDSLKSVNHHIKLWAHKKKSQKVNQKIQKPELKKICYDKFVKLILDTDPFKLNSDVVVNDKFCVSYFSLMFYTSIIGNNYRIRCQACETNLTVLDLMDHKSSEEHEEAVKKGCIIISEELKSEFVREVRPNIYHCGFCNMIVLSWENMELHLSSMEHRIQKTKSESLLQQHAPLIQEYHFQRQLQSFLFNML